MSINHLYHTWFNRIEQLRPGERVTRLSNLAWLLVGICRSKSVHLSKVALQIPGEANTPSITRRLSRFLDNPAIRVREWYEPVARDVLQAIADTVVRMQTVRWLENTIHLTVALRSPRNERRNSRSFLS